MECPIEAVSGQQTFLCDSNNELVSIMCSFDGGETENCSFPLVVAVDRFGIGCHTVDITVRDVFGQSLDLSFSFRFEERKISSFVEF